MYLLGNVAIFVDVVEVERPPQLLCHRASKQHRQSDHKVLWNPEDALLSAFWTKTQVKHAFPAHHHQRYSGVGCFVVAHRVS